MKKRPPAITEDDLAIVEALRTLVGDREPNEIDQARLNDALGRYRKGRRNGAVQSLVTQLECNLGIFCEKMLSFRDKTPALDTLAHRRSILAALEAAILGQFQAAEADRYEVYVRFINVGGRRVEVEEQVQPEYGLILYRATTGERYLDVLKNNSAAYWSETARIEEAEAQALLADPTYERALSILAEAQRRANVS